MMFLAVPYIHKTRWDTTDSKVHRHDKKHKVQMYLIHQGSIEAALKVVIVCAVCMVNDGSSEKVVICVCNLHCS